MTKFIMKANSNNSVSFHNKLTETVFVLIFIMFFLYKNVFLHIYLIKFCLLFLEL